MDKPRMPRTRAQKGRLWATATLVVCLSFSLWANVESGRFEAKSIAVSAMPPIVAFFCSHLISYFAPRTKLMKTVIYGGFGAITAFAMYGSGYHIINFVMSTGQPWETAISYVFITDAPMLLAAGILIEKVTTARSATAPAKQATTAPVKTTAPNPKVTTVAKTTTAPKATKATTPAKAAKAAKATVPVFKAPIPDIKDDVREEEMLSA